MFNNISDKLKIRKMNKEQIRANRTSNKCLLLIYLYTEICILGY